MERMGAIHPIVAKAQEFAALLAEWTQNIVEVFAIGDLAEEYIEPRDQAILVCVFEPESSYEGFGFGSVFHLQMQDDEGKVSNAIGFENPYDLGFVIGDSIYLPDGSVIGMGDKRLTLWSKGDE